MKVISFSDYKKNRNKEIPTEKINDAKAHVQSQNDALTYVYEQEGYKIVIKNCNFLSYRILNDVADAIIPFLQQQYDEREIGPRVKEIYGSRCDFHVRYDSHKRTIKVLVERAS